jgi:hypothetical protein
MGRARQEVGLSLVLAIQATIMFVVAPLSATGQIIPGVVDAFRFGLATVAVLMVTRHRLASGIIVVTFCASLLLTLALRAGAQATAASLFRLAATSAFDLAIAIAVARVAFGPGRVTVHRILGGVILYLSIGLLFANAYRACALLLHPSFSGLPPDRRAALSQLLYFSLSTLTTTGFGDIAPLHPFVRSLANLEGVIGQLFPATLLARLVTLHTARQLEGGNSSEAG